MILLGHFGCFYIFPKTDAKLVILFNLGCQLLWTVFFFPIQVCTHHSLTSCWRVSPTSLLRLQLFLLEIVYSSLNSKPSGGKKSLGLLNELQTYGAAPWVFRTRLEVGNVGIAAATLAAGPCLSFRSANSGCVYRTKGNGWNLLESLLIHVTVSGR